MTATHNGRRVLLTPTKDTGAQAKASPLLYTEPEQQLTDEQLVTQLQIDGADAPFLADLLSAFITHERCARHLYRSVAGRTAREDFREQYEHFGQETERHVEILEQLITLSGGNPAYVSPMARAVEASDSKLLESTFLTTGSADPDTAEVTLLDAVFLGESADHANWLLLDEIADRLPRSPFANALRIAVDEVLTQEDEHLGWASEAKAELLLSLALGATGERPPRRSRSAPPAAAPADGAAPSAEDHEPTKQELYEQAQGLDIPGRSHMSKAELAKALKRKAKRGTHSGK